MQRLAEPMTTTMKAWRRLEARLAGRTAEGIALLVARVALAAVFWSSGRTKVVDGTWLQVSDTTRFLFAEEYAGVPLPPDLAATLATHAEFFLPILLVLGLGTRLCALGLLGMTLVIQTFVYPGAWQAHLLWAGLALTLVSRGAGVCSLDALARRALAARTMRPPALRRAPAG
jgi:putative oxidoreductase